MNQITKADGRFKMKKKENSIVKIGSIFGTDGIDGNTRFIKLNMSIWIDTYGLENIDDIENFRIVLPPNVFHDFYNHEFKLKVSHEEYSGLDSKLYYVCEILMDQNILYEITDILGPIDVDLMYIGEDTERVMDIESHLIIEEFDNIKLYDGEFENIILGEE